jgi:hypothetical protein
MQNLIAIHAKNRSTDSLRRDRFSPKLPKMLLTSHLSQATHNCCPCCLCCAAVRSGVGRLTV